MSGQIRYVKFSLLNDKKKLKISTVEVKNSNIFPDDTPAANGVFDSKMGTTSIKYNCKTCGLSHDNCPGHFGHIKLNYPLKEPIVAHEIKDWVNSICKECGKPVITGLKKIETNRFAELKSMVKEKYIDGVIDCQYCRIKNNKQTRQRFVDTAKDDDYKLGYLEDRKFIVYTNEEIKDHLSKITNKTLKFLQINKGFHPKYFITNVILVPPVNIRPEIRKIEGSISSSDELTKILQMVVTYNQKIKDDPKYVDHLQDIYVSLVLADGDQKTVKTASHKNFKSLSTTLKYKKGYIRNATQGKKVDKVVRTVIVGDPSIEPGWVTISTKNAMKLYKRELVNERNIDELLIYFENGKNVYPGSVRVERNGRIKDVEIFKKQNTLKIGDYLYRHLIYADVADFNRMPSLWWSSVSGHKLIVIDDDWTMRFNESSCIAFNADFDGDEMNLFLSNNTFSIYEVKCLSNVKNWGLNFLNAACMVGLMQDGMLGIGLLTQDNNKFTLKEAFKMFNQCKSYISIDLLKQLSNKGILTGRDLISAIFLYYDCIINYRRKSNVDIKFAKHFGYKEDDLEVLIQNGRLITGILDKPNVGQDKNDTIFHTIINKKGLEVANNVVYDLQQMGIYYLSIRGFTTGIKEIMPEKSKNLIDIVNNMVIESADLHNRYINNKMIIPINKTIDEFYEEKQMAACELGSDYMNDFTKLLEFNNGIRLMGSIGSKGSMLQLINVMGIRGQTKVFGRRPKKVLNGRTSIYSTRESSDPEDSGFIRRSLIEGLTSKNSLFDAQEERLGIVNKSQNTAVTGYFNRLFIKSNELEMIDNKFSVISNNEIVQLLFGGDGIDPRKKESNELPDLTNIDKLKCEIKDVDKIYKHKQMEDILNKEYENIVKWRNYYIETMSKLEIIENDHIISKIIRCPVNVKRTIYDNLKETKKPLDPKKAIDDLNLWIDKIICLHTNEWHKSEDLPDFILQSFNSLKVLLYLTLNVKTLINMKLDNEIFVNILRDLYIQYSSAFIDPGTLSGIIMGQSIGKPATQGMLNSIHKSSKKGDIDSIKDVTELRKNKLKDGEASGLKNPYMRFEVDDPEKFINEIEMKQLVKFIKSIQLMFKPIKEQPLKEFLKYNSVNLNISNICCRIELKKIDLIIKDISIDKIVFALYDHFNNFVINKTKVEVFIAHTFMEDNDLFIYIYLVSIPKVELNLVKKKMLEHVKKCIIDGVEGIKSASIETRTRTFIENNKIVRKDHKYVITEGVNISLYNKGIIQETFGTNSILEIHSKFGIVAAEQSIISECKMQIEESGEHLDESWYINLGSSMTYSGVPLPNTSHGIKKRYKNNKSLMITTENIIDTLKHAIKEETEQMITGLSESSLYSSTVQAGTCYNKLMVNNKFIKDNYKSSEQLIEEIDF